MFYTGDGETSPVRRYVIDVLDVGWLIENINGALALMGVPENWTVEGDISADIAAERSNDFIVTFRRFEVLIGSIAPYATASVPTDTLACDGTNYLRVDYPQLYAVLHSTYIIDADNFITPDLRGVAIIGTGTGTGLTARAMGDTGGSETHQLTIAELPAHDHQTTTHQHFYDKPVLNLDLEAPGAPDILGLGQPFTPALTSAEGVDVLSTGSDDAHNNMPPFHAVRYCIVAR